MLSVARMKTVECDQSQGADKQRSGVNIKRETVTRNRVIKAREQITKRWDHYDRRMSTAFLIY